jgi:hypothetical protein
MCYCLKLKAGLSTKDVRYYMESYAERITQGTACHEYSVTYQRVKLPTRKELLKKYDVICKRKQKIHDRWQALAALLNPKDMPCDL